MKLQRRWRLSSGCLLLAVAGALVADGAALRPKCMEVLPLGNVRAEGWLLRQLEKQRDGLTGHAEELYADIGKSRWLPGNPKGDGWERGPYYAKGLVALAFTLDDAVLKERAKKWVDAILASQRANGDFGPKEDNWWPNMIVLHLLRDWAAATGDARVELFMRRYFAYQLKRLPEKDLYSEDCWAASRAGDELEVIFWLVDRTGDESLLETARLLCSQATDWTSYYYANETAHQKTGYRRHIVNFMQGLRFPILRTRLMDNGIDRGVYSVAFGPDGWPMRRHGRVDRMINGSEPLSGLSASEGTELCAIAERILSCREIVSVTGDAYVADDMESAAFNSLPTAISADGCGVRYYSLLNQTFCTLDRPLGFASNPEGGSNTPGPDSGYGCCRSNYHFAWPKFTQSLWMRREGGLAAVAYAPNTVKTDVATIRSYGLYPFGDTFELEIVAAKGGSWPLFVRIPVWGVGVKVHVNGVAEKRVLNGVFHRIEREWKAGDRVSLSLGALPRAVFAVNGSVAIRRGALVYSMPIAAETRAVDNLRTGSAKTKWATREYRPSEAWNRALVLEKTHAHDDWVAAEFKPAAGWSDDPFAEGARPCTLRIGAGVTSAGDWGRQMSASNVCSRAVEPPASPLASGDVGGVGTLELVPMGSTQLRITLFPWIGKTQTEGRK